MLQLNNLRLYKKQISDLIILQGMSIKHAKKKYSLILF